MNNFDNDLKNIISFLKSKKINILVVHGLTTSTHSHYFIHEAIYKTFLYIKSQCDFQLEVIWCDDNKESSELYNENNNYLIFSSPHYNTDNHLIILENAYYILHYRTHNVLNKNPIKKYNDLYKKKRAIKYIEFRGPPRQFQKSNNITFINNLFWYYKDLSHPKFPTSELNIPWATDLLPNEIDRNIESLYNNQDYNRRSYFCGSIWKTNKKEVNEWKLLCMKNGISCLFDREKDKDQHQNKIRYAYMAPAFQGETQRCSNKYFYIPCRIFKNISYGGLPITNNKGVYNMFKDYSVIFDTNLESLFNKVLEYRYWEKENKDLYIQQMVDIMNHVKENHTFVNRINMLIQFGFI